MFVICVLGKSGNALFERASAVAEEECGNGAWTAMRGDYSADIEHLYLAFEFGERFFKSLFCFFRKFGTI